VPSRSGGAQAVGALAYGTATIAAVDKITAPATPTSRAPSGAVFGKVGIDMIAGPSEILGAGRRQHAGPTGSRWTCSARPSTTSWRRASCCVPDAAYIAQVKAAIDRLLPGCRGAT
jgi:histidinol dehydrogenase